MHEGGQSDEGVCFGLPGKPRTIDGVLGVGVADDLTRGEGFNAGSSTRGRVGVWGFACLGVFESEDDPALLKKDRPIRRVSEALFKSPIPLIRRRNIHLNTITNTENRTLHSGDRIRHRRRLNRGSGKPVSPSNIDSVI